MLLVKMAKMQAQSKWLVKTLKWRRPQRLLRTLSLVLSLMEQKLNLPMFWNLLMNLMTLMFRQEMLAILLCSRMMFLMLKAQSVLKVITELALLKHRVTTLILLLAHLFWPTVNGWLILLISLLMPRTKALLNLVWLLVMWRLSQRIILT